MDLWVGCTQPSADCKSEKKTPHWMNLTTHGAPDMRSGLALLAGLRAQAKKQTTETGQVKRRVPSQKNSGPLREDSGDDL